MLNKSVESQNEVTIVGTLNELDIVEGTTGDGRDYVRGTAYIKVDQEINGMATENIIPVRMFSMKLKKGTNEVSKIYSRIISYKTDLKSIAAVEDISEASRVSVNAKISENAFYNDKTGKIISSFQVESNFINKAKSTDEDVAKFLISGVVLSKIDELNNDESTGRLIVNMGVIGYGEKLSVIKLYATDSKKSHIENNWETKETVRVAGLLNVTHEVKVIKDDSGFGEPIEKKKTIYKDELIITGGSASGLEEDYSYDATDISSMLETRKVEQENLKNKTKINQSRAAAATSNGFGF